MAANEFSILSATDGAPQVVGGDGELLPVTVSLSHSSGRAVAALCSLADAPLGIDIEVCESRVPGFLSDFFTTSEVALVERTDTQARERVTTEMWSLKEAALKALRVGLRADTRTVEACPRVKRETGWASASVRLADGTCGAAFVRDSGPFVISLVWLGAQSPGEPTVEQGL